jgi:hypothetical protein
VPDGIVMTRVRDADGQRAENTEGGASFQAFKAGTGPIRADPATGTMPQQGRFLPGSAITDAAARARAQ